MKNTMEAGKISSVNLGGLTCEHKWLKHLPKGERNPFMLYEYITISKAMWRLLPRSDRLKGEMGQNGNIDNQRTTAKSE